MVDYSKNLCKVISNIPWLRCRQDSENPQVTENTIFVILMECIMREALMKVSIKHNGIV